MHCKHAHNNEKCKEKRKQQSIDFILVDDAELFVDFNTHTH